MNRLRKRVFLSGLDLNVEAQTVSLFADTSGRLPSIKVWSRLRRSWPMSKRWDTSDMLI